MLKKTIKYIDFNGVEQEEEFHFHLTPPDLLELEATSPGGFEKYMNDIMEANDGARILELFKKLIKMSIGHVSEDGKRFEKSEEITNNFVQTNAYTVLFLELGSDADTASKFFNGIIPQDLAERVEQLQSAGTQRERVVAEATPISGGAQSPKVITRAEAKAMSKDELMAKLQDGWTIQT